MLFEIPAFIEKLVSFIDSIFEVRTGLVLRSNANAGLNCPRCPKFHMLPRCNNHLLVALSHQELSPKHQCRQHHQKWGSPNKQSLRSTETKSWNLTLDKFYEDSGFPATLYTKMVVFQDNDCQCLGEWSLSYIFPGHSPLPGGGHYMTDTNIQTRTQYKHKYTIIRYLKDMSEAYFLWMRRIWLSMM